MKKTIVSIILLLILLAGVYFIVTVYKNQVRLENESTPRTEAELVADYNKLISEKKLVLKYPTYQEAANAVQQFTGLDSLKVHAITFTLNDDIDGDTVPYFKLRGVIDVDKNICMDGRFDLIRGVGEVHRDACRVE